MNHSLKICRFAAAITVIFAANLFAAELWRPPAATPPGCPQVIDVRLELIDVSRSMNEMRRLDRAKSSAIRYIESEAPPCTLVVVGTFGVTADVQSADFLTDTEARSRLTTIVRRLVADHQYTNLDEAAKLIELLELQIRLAYPRRHGGLSVRVYSDMSSAPSAGKMRFDLASFLAPRLPAGQTRVTSSSRVEQQDIHIQPERSSNVKPRIEPSSVTPATRPSAIRARGAWPDMGWARSVPAVVGVLGLCGVALVCAWRLRFPRARHSSPHERLHAFVVQERTRNDQGQTIGARESRVDATDGVPIVFSTDPNLATYVVEPITGVAVGELFSIKPFRDGIARVQTKHPNVDVNGKPLRVGQTLEIPLREAILVDVAPYLFEVSAVFSASAPSRPGAGAFNAAPLQR